MKQVKCPSCAHWYEVDSALDKYQYKCTYCESAYAVKTKNSWNEKGDKAPVSRKTWKRWGDMHWSLVILNNIGVVIQTIIFAIATIIGILVAPLWIWFLSPKTKERISKLEAENAIAASLAEKKGSGSKKSLCLIAVTVLLSALLVYQFFGQSNLSEELTQKSVELWRGGQAVDTVFAAIDELVFSVQIGS